MLGLKLVAKVAEVLREGVDGDPNTSLYEEAKTVIARLHAEPVNYDDAHWVNRIILDASTAIGSPLGLPQDAPREAPDVDAYRRYLVRAGIGIVCALADSFRND